MGMDGMRDVCRALDISKPSTEPFTLLHLTGVTTPHPPVHFPPDGTDSLLPLPRSPVPCPIGSDPCTGWLRDYRLPKY